MDIEYKKINQFEIRKADQFLNSMGMSEWNFKIDPDYCFVATFQTEIVGISAGRLSKDGVSGFAGITAVEPAYRKKGIIKKLHVLKIESLKSAGAKTILADASNPVVTKYLSRDFGFRFITSFKNERGNNIDRLIWDVSHC